MNKKAFTLIELLVMLVIIGVLIGLLVPVIRGAIDSAKTAACVNNLRQIYLGIQMYADDHGERWMPFNDPGPGAYIYSSWVWSGTDTRSIGILYPQYVDDPDIFWCPGSKENMQYMEKFEKTGVSSFSNYTTFGYGNVPSGQLNLLKRYVLVCDSTTGTINPCGLGEGPHRRKYNALCGDGAIRLIDTYSGLPLP